MGILRRFKGWYDTWVRYNRLEWPYGLELIDFQCNGCMATIWDEQQRGVIIDRIQKPCASSGTPLDYYVVRRDDGSDFHCYVPYCSPGEAYMQAWTNKPEESLIGKMVYTH